MVTTKKTAKRMVVRELRNLRASARGKAAQLQTCRCCHCARCHR